jgi:major vault protein
MAEPRDKDLVLSPGEFAYILDTTKGFINVLVGPNKTSLSATDTPVVWNQQHQRFVPCNQDDAKQAFVSAQDGYYVILTNPAPSGQAEHPNEGTPSPGVTLQFGRRVVMPGPRYFPLWPRQHAEVIQGHQLRSDQYLIARIYNEEQARLNWDTAVVKRGVVKPEGTKPEGEEPAGDPPKDGSIVPPMMVAPDRLTMGQLIVIKGTQVSFYIPPTGVEVVQDSNKQYVRDAVTLERLEYCILLDQDGNKRIVQGPAVVFPESTETFTKRQGSDERGDARKFRAIELNEISGIHIKVIAEYTDERGPHKIGDELFITGEQQSIYFPRAEHAIIKYGERQIYYATAVPAGEGRYVLDRNVGNVKLERGPKMLLPDPRKEVIVLRRLDPKQVELWFPGNQEALDYNARLAEQADAHAAEPSLGMMRHAAASEKLMGATAAKSFAASAGEFAGDEFNRKSGYAPPRTVTLNTKYAGAVMIEVWTGYAVLVESMTGQRRVVLGPTTILLEYDEKLGAMALSTGKPKNTDELLHTAYLRVANNLVSDIIRAETKDLCQVNIKVSYRINFEGDQNKWFNVENYVKFLTDHLRSRIKNAVKRLGIEEFYANYIDIVRDTVLGKAEEGRERSGRLFTENGMRVYEVEVFTVEIGDEAIAGLLKQAQHDSVRETLQIAKAERDLAFTKRAEVINRESMLEKAQTREKEFSLKTEAVALQLKLNMAEVEAAATVTSQKLASEKASQVTRNEMKDADRTQMQADEELKLKIAQEQLKQEIEQLQAEAKALSERAGAISPDLIAALSAFASADLTARAAQAMSPLAIIGGESVVDVLSKLLKGTPLENVMQHLPSVMTPRGDGAGSRSRVG